jgi:glycogen operon protein
MLMRESQPDLSLTCIPSCGPVVAEGCATFRVVSQTATAMRLLLYDTVADTEPAEVIDFDPKLKLGSVWQTLVKSSGHGQLYHLQADGPRDPERGLWFDGRARLIDPYARALAGDFQRLDDGVLRPPKCVVIDDHFDWRGDRCLNHPLADTVIYEMHVGGFTRSPTSRVKHPGTYLGVIEKIPYLKSLGVTAVELMPVHEFPILDIFGNPRQHPNYWGYDPLAFFAPHRGYAAGKEPGSQVSEFKEMVRALHEEGIEVILDLVFNHTAEGNERGPVLSFKGLDNHVYYMTDHGGRYYRNYSGCGNTVNCNHPTVKELIIDCLRHWTVHYHVDGFRFDLAAVLRRRNTGEILFDLSLVDEIAADPYLASTKLIAEAWDAGGAFLVGNFGGKRWAEWNGHFRDDVRRFWRGDQGLLGALATRLAGSSDLYERSGRSPSCSVNFVTSHDGFTLNDLVSHCYKHNEANGEANCDGDNNNWSDNYGFEGPTHRVEVEELRIRQIKNMLSTLLLSHGVPMLLMGDECRRTQRGNNNAYCQDNEISWFDWRLVHSNRELVRFCRALIKFRLSQPTLRRESFLTGKPHSHDTRPDVSWFDNHGQSVHWESGTAALTCLLTRPPADRNPEGAGRDILLMLNASHGPQEFLFPPAARLSGQWRLFINTASHAPNDVYPGLIGPSPPKSGRHILPSRTLICYVADAPGKPPNEAAEIPRK